jgi:membrane-associated protein
VLRGTIAWVAGLAGMSWSRFLIWNALGGLVWATAVGLLAYLGGRALADAVSRYGHDAGVALACGAVVVAVGPRLIARVRRA